MSDKKGGHLAKRKSDGRLVLRESAMTPDGDKASFEDISKHKFFNTNNLWVNLEKLQASLSTSLIYAWKLGGKTPGTPCAQHPGAPKKCLSS